MLSTAGACGFTQAMCNEYQLRLKFDASVIRHEKIPIRWPDPASNRPLDRPFRPTNRAPMLRAVRPATAWCT